MAHGRLYRADALHSAALDESGVLHALGLRLVCDLRSDGERKLTPCLDWLEPAPRFLHLDLSANVGAEVTSWLQRLVRGPDPEAAAGLMRATYATLPRSAAAMLGKLFESLASGELPALVHCTAGKDRTGFTIAMILAALGVSRDAILADYALGSGRDPLTVESPSGRIFLDLIGRSLETHEAAILNGVRREFLETSLAVIDEGWGSVERYLGQAIGVDAPLRRALREHLLA